MRAYNHWTVLGILAEFLPQPENRVQLADEKDSVGMPVAHFNYSQCENDRAITAFAKNILAEIWDGADAQDTLTIDRYAHLVGGARMGFSPAEFRRRPGIPWLGYRQPIHRGRLRPPDPGRGEPALVIMALADRFAASCRKAPPEPHDLKPPLPLRAPTRGDPSRRAAAAGGVLQALIDGTESEELKTALQHHLEQTRTHVERVETVFAGSR